MKKWILIGVVIVGAGWFLSTRKGKVLQKTAMTYVHTPSYINKQGATVLERTITLDGYTRKEYPTHSFSAYIQKYPLHPYGTEVINYDGNPYVYQAGHIGVFTLPVPSDGLQQCADALIRLRAEYLWDRNKKEDIGFNFTSGDYCSWDKYAQGFRPKINGSDVTFQKTATKDHSKENFYRYLKLIYTYSGTLSLFHELPKVSTIEDVEVGDMLIHPGSPGHVMMVVDKSTNAAGENLLIFAQGNTPAQSVHMIKNPNDPAISPWYEIELGTRLDIPTYSFTNVQFVRFKDQ